MHLYLSLSMLLGDEDDERQETKDEDYRTIEMSDGVADQSGNFVSVARIFGEVKSLLGDGTDEEIVKIR